MIFLKVEYEGKAFPIWYCCKWSKWNRCGQVSQFQFFPFSYSPFWMLSDNKVIKISSSCRFDYIVRDSRACGLGCNFQFERYLLVSSRGLNLIVSYMLWWTLHFKLTQNLCDIGECAEVWTWLTLNCAHTFCYYTLVKKGISREPCFPLNFQVDGIYASYGWWDMLPCKGLLVYVKNYFITFTLEVVIFFSLFFISLSDLTIHKLFATRADLHRTVYTHAKVKVTIPTTFINVELQDSSCSIICINVFNLHLSTKCIRFDSVSFFRQ